MVAMHVTGMRSVNDLGLHMRENVSHRRVDVTPGHGVEPGGRKVHGVRFADSKKLVDTPSFVPDRRHLFRAEPGHLAARADQNMNGITVGHVPQDCATNAKYLVVGMRRYDKYGRHFVAPFAQGNGPLRFIHISLWSGVVVGDSGLRIGFSQFHSGRGKAREVPLPALDQPAT